MLLSRCSFFKWRKHPIGSVFHRINGSGMICIGVHKCRAYQPSEAMTFVTISYDRNCMRNEISVDALQQKPCTAKVQIHINKICLSFWHRNANRHLWWGLTLWTMVPYLHGFTWHQCINNSLNAPDCKANIHLITQETHQINKPWIITTGHLTVAFDKYISDRRQQWAIDKDANAVLSPTVRPNLPAYDNTAIRVKIRIPVHYAINPGEGEGR